MRDKGKKCRSPHVTDRSRLAFRAGFVLRGCLCRRVLCTTSSVSKKIVVAEMDVPSPLHITGREQPAIALHIEGGQHLPIGDEMKLHSSGLESFEISAPGFLVASPHIIFIAMPKP